MNRTPTGFFYLGKIIDPKTSESTGKPFYYDSKNLTTHAMTVGMTGSGKTGLGIALLEEAGLNSIPAIIIDPKGDLSNLLLTFPNLSKEDFLPWVDSEEAKKKSMTDEVYAENLSNTWKEGLLNSEEDLKRIQTLKDSVDIDVYTPASRSGKPISILNSFKAPDELLRNDEAYLRDHLMSLTSSLLGLVGIDADPIKSKEYILISTILDHSFAKGEDLNLIELIEQIQSPKFEKVGALPLDTFFPEKERLQLSIKINGLIASKSFQTWMEGEPLDIQTFLYNKENKPKLSIISIAHLSDSERMFFVTLLLGTYVSWMRRQPGSQTLKTLLYMDEIFGFFPPTANPPSKLPMLNLLKTARAYGVGIILATQNPVDIDYKGLSNCGTWFIGKLQTERDKLRVLEGLKVASNGELDSRALDEMMSSIKKRRFILRSIHEKEPVIFETRWTLSYLKGPMTLKEIERFTKKDVKEIPISKELNESFKTKTFIPKSVPEYYINNPSALRSGLYLPFILTKVKLHYVDTKLKIDTWKEKNILLPLKEKDKNIDFEQKETVLDLKEKLEKTAVETNRYGQFETSLLEEKSLALFQKNLINHLYQMESLSLFEQKDFQMISKPDEAIETFKERVKQKGEEIVQVELEKIDQKYLTKMNELVKKLNRADDKLTTKKQKSLWQKFEAFISFLSTILQAFLGKGITKSTISQVGTSIKRVGRISKETEDAVLAEDNVRGCEKEIEDLKKKKDEELLSKKEEVKTALNQIDNLEIKLKKSDIVIDEIALVWIEN